MATGRVARPIELTTLVNRTKYLEATPQDTEGCSRLLSARRS
jgi:hypothetical protein